MASRLTVGSLTISLIDLRAGEPDERLDGAIEFVGDDPIFEGREGADDRRQQLLVPQ